MKVYRNIPPLMLALLIATVIAPAVETTSSTDGNLSRTFFWHGSAEWQAPADAEVGGAGWYDPNDPENLCLFRLWRLSSGSGFYYDTLRTIPNGLNVHTDTVPETLITSNCPFPGAEGDGSIGTSEAEIRLGSSITQSHLLCLETPSPCIPDPGTATWYLFTCDAEDATFTKNGDPIVPPIDGSTSISCGNPLDEHKATFLLDPENSMQTSSHLPVDHLVMNDHPSSYVISCYSIEYQHTATSSVSVAESHDWFLVVSREDAAGAVAIHLDQDAQGLYDLSGDNGCDPDSQDTPARVFTRELTVADDAECSCKANPITCNIEVDILEVDDEVKITRDGEVYKHFGIRNVEIIRHFRVDGSGYYVLYRAPAFVTIVSTNGGDVTGCHLRQDVVDQYGLRGTGEIKDDGVAEKDYSSEMTGRHDYYGGWWLYDAPLRRTGADDKSVFEKYFWQAKVFIEEAPAVEAFWGFQYQADLDDKEFTESERFSQANKRNNPYD